MVVVIPVSMHERIGNIQGEPVSYTEQDVKDFLDVLFRRCEAARNAGGVALQDVVEGTQRRPEGWVLDIQTCYYLPPNVRLF